MQSYVMCGLETHFLGLPLLVLNMSQFILSLALGFYEFSLTVFFGPCKILFAIMGCLAISLLIFACLGVGSIVNHDEPRSGIPFWATILLAIVQFGLYSNPYQ